MPPPFSRPPPYPAAVVAFDLVGRVRRVCAAAGEKKVLYGRRHARFREWRFIPPSEPTDAADAKPFELTLARHRPAPAELTAARDAR